MPNNLIAQIANEFISGNTQQVVDVVTFVEAPWGLGIDLLPAQKFMLKCFYGMPLDSNSKSIEVPDVLNEKILYRFSEREFLGFLKEEGRCNTDVIEGKNFHELVMVLGRRGTKSTLASCISNYELYKLVKRGDPSEHYGFPSNTEIVILNVAPTDDQAGVVFGMIQGMATKCPYLKDRSLHQTMTYFDLQTDADRKLHGKPRASLLSIAGGCSSNSLRGRNAIVVVMDEMAFFIDKDNSRFSGGEVYKALTPSMSSFGKDGKVICLSSPYAKFGRFYERYMESFDEQDYTLMFRMYSAMSNPTIPSEILRAAYRRDRSSFMCEYGGEFSDRVTAWVEIESELKKCVTVKPAPSRGKPDTPYYMGIDLGFQNDGTAISIVHREQKKVILDYADVWFSGSSDVWEFQDGIYRNCTKYRDKELLRIADIVSEVKSLCRWFPIKRGIFDQSNGYALAELLSDAGFNQFEMTHFTDQMNHEVFELVKRLYSEWLIELFDHPVLIPEMLSLEATKMSKGRVDVAAPGRRGAHDDISDSFTRAVWACYNVTGNRAPCHATGAGGVSGGSMAPIRTKAGPQVKMETQASFSVRRLKMHGQSPRALPKSQRRMVLAGGVRHG